LWNQFIGFLFEYFTPAKPGPNGSVKIGYHRQGHILDSTEFVLSPEGREAISKLNHKRKKPISGSSQVHYDFDEFSWTNISEFISSHLPGLSYDIDYFFRCIYTNTPDKNYIVGIHPEDPDIIICAAFNGGGFKDGGGMGDVVQSFITGNSTVYSEEEVTEFKHLWRPSRFFKKLKRHH